MGPTRRLLGVVLTAFLGFALTPVLASPAQAEDLYTFWNYAHGDGSSGWAYAKTGPADYTPETGDVEGWRYGLSGGVPDNFATPRAASDFDAICGDVAPDGGKKIVAVVVDYGIPDEAADGDTPPEPVGRCAEVDEGFNGLQVLQSVLTVDAKGGFLTAIEGYPATADNSPAKDATMPTDEPTVDLAVPDNASVTQSTSGTVAGQESEQDSGAPWTLIAIAAVVVAIGGGAIALSRRNS